MVTWLKNENLNKLMKVINPSMAVGGCVRNYMMGKDFNSEVDLATPLLPEEVMKLAKKAGFTVIPTGLQHGTVTCVMGDDVFEITTLRVDVETDGRHASVEFSNSWEEDAKRRDLTMNALYSDINGEIYDFVGGLADLKKGLIKFIGKADLRIQEDYLRILRFFRFLAHYGKQYDHLSLVACGKYVENLKQIARERCTNEMMKLLEGENFLTSLKFMNDIKIWKHCDFPEPDFVALRRLCSRKTTLGKASAIAKLSTFKGDVSGMKLSNVQRKHVDILRNQKIMIENADYVKWINDAPSMIWADGFLLKSELNDLTFLDIWKKNLFKFSGNEVMKVMGVEPGPKVKYYLDQLKDWFVMQKQPPTGEEMMAQLHNIKKN